MNKTKKKISLTFQNQTKRVLYKKENRKKKQENALLTIELKDL